MLYDRLNVRSVPSPFFVFAFLYVVGGDMHTVDNAYAIHFVYKILSTQVNIIFHYYLHYFHFVLFEKCCLHGDGKTNAMGHKS